MGRFQLCCLCWIKVEERAQEERNGNFWSGFCGDDSGSVAVMLPTDLYRELYRAAPRGVPGWDFGALPTQTVPRCHFPAPCGVAPLLQVEQCTREGIWGAKIVPCEGGEALAALPWVPAGGPGRAGDTWDSGRWPWRGRAATGWDFRSFPPHTALEFQAGRLHPVLAFKQLRFLVVVVIFFLF